MRLFYSVWGTQLASVLASYLTEFALSVWVYQRTQSITDFAYTSLFSTLPGMLVAPLAGTVVDLYDRRTVMMLADSVAVLCTVAMMLLEYSAQSLQVWHVCLSGLVVSIANTFQGPAYQTSLVQLVPKTHLDRANAMVEVGDGLCELVCPLLASALLVSVGLPVIMLIDVCAFLVAVLTLAVVRFPPVPRSADGRASDGSWIGELGLGFRWLATRPGLVALVLTFAVANFVSEFIFQLVPPLILRIASVQELGYVSSFAGTGVLLSSVAVAVRGAPSARVMTICLVLAAQGLVMFCAVLHLSCVTVAFSGFVYMLGEPLLQACSQGIWMTKVPTDLQGRVHSARRIVTTAAIPLATVLSGHLADHFERWFAEDGPLIGSPAAMIMGVGPGRGICCLFVTLGLIAVTSSLLALLYGPLRHLEASIPDAFLVVREEEGEEHEEEYTEHADQRLKDEHAKKQR
eukprot:CAMPEP_0174230514 /NCGR_PEP_ID=MMETSP0417-20130205/1251_1 /TAXON_ID=242541 /ORGANISM="Mayorella sp, Strain BSH-02190019" /LENGTH=459 /DNA_ID=CAMNT_0015308215 /DNA_START=233 /DNA_END=1612 /DNA_ORIENTATION=-